tara:strand:- start:27595 stop:30768 length:3174 start_codon:yes stop_codon:yes gene_type:complete
MKDKILKIAGVKSEAAFYKKFPTEAAFKKAHGKELKKALVGASIAPEIGSYTGGQRVSSPANINYNQLYDDTDLSITGMNEAKRMQAQNLDAQREIAAKTGKGGGGGMQDLIKGLGSAASAMGGAKHGKKLKKAPGGIGLDQYNPDTISYGSPSTAGAQITQAGANAATAGAQASAVNQSPFANIAKGIPVVGKLVGAFQANAAEKKAMKLAEQTAGVSAISRQAADTRPEQMRRKYVRPEDMAFGTQEMGQSYGTGTNYLSRNGSVIGGNPTQIQNTYAPNNTLYDDLGYEPLEDSDQVKQYRRGGLVKAQGGFMTQFSNFATSPQGGDVLNQAGTLAGGNNAGSQFGDAIGDAAKFIPGIGPIASAAIKPIANLVGGLLDRKPKKTAAFKQQAQGNMENMAFTSGVKGLQGQNQAFMEDGGWMNPEYNPQVIAKFGDHTAQDYYNAGHEGMNSLRAGGHLTNYTAPSERAMETYALGGELKTLWGGHAEPISQNPYLPGTGETVMFRGQSHDDGGIGVSYGNKGKDSYTDYAEYGTEAAMDNADVEVEGGEPMVELEEGGQIDPETGEAQKAGVVFGNLVLHKQLAKDHGFGKEAGRKMKHIVKDWSKGEAKQNKIIEKSLDIIDNSDDTTAFGQLAFATAKAMNQGANMKLKKYADDKRTLAGIQGAINDTAAEHSVVADDLARGKVKIDRSNNNMAKFGASLEKAKGGGKTKKKEKLTPYKKIVFESMKPGYLSPLDIPEGTLEDQLKEKRDAMNRRLYLSDPRNELDRSGMKHENLVRSEAKVPAFTAPSQLSPKKTDWVNTGMMAYNEVLPYLRPNYQIEQPDFSSEMMAAGMNQVDPVQAQLFTPNLTQPYDVSFQDQLNANQADYNALQRMTGYNPAAQSALAAQKYAANSKILGEQFRVNQGEKARAYEENRKLMDQAQLGNLGILDKQYERQATAKSKTKQQSIEIAKSISDKLAQAKKEQKMSDLEQQRYNFRFDSNGRPINMNPLATFNMSGSGARNKGSIPGMGNDWMTLYDEYGEFQGTKRKTKKDKDDKSRNGSIVKAIKNL